jgi:SAM-dependent methyltransferase
MERMSATWLDTMLVDQWLPAVDGMVARLERGGTVADVGSGAGRALIALANRFPDSEFIGYDLYAPNVERAAAAAKAAGVRDRVRFCHADATTDLAGPLDLVTMLDVLHDAPDPEAVLGAAREALAPASGALLLLESASAADPEENSGPSGQILYATSALHCVPTALAGGGPALGTLGLPGTEVTRLARRAGFAGVDELPTQNPMLALFVLRP